jgi:hypothetical protein
MTLDVRKCQLARLDRDYARLAWKAYKKTSHNQKTSGQCHNR